MARAAPAHTQPPPGLDRAHDFRVRRQGAVLQQQSRRTQVINRGPQLDVQWVNAIVAADSLWGSDEQWQQVVDRQLSSDVDDSQLLGILTSDAAPAEPPAPPSPRRWRRRVTTGSPPPAAASGPAPARSGTPVEGSVDDFVVSRAGRAHRSRRRSGRARRSPGRGRSWTVRLALIVAPLVLVGGVAYAAGVRTGSARIPATAAISDAEAARYHLSTYPAVQAAAYGATYLTLCLTHPDPEDAAAVTDRLAGLSRMVSAGVSPSCGWDGSGGAEQPLSITWDGTATPAQTAAYTHGRAAHLGYLVTYAGGRIGGVSLPIWAGAGDSYTGMRVVGDVALMPATPPTAAPPAKVPGVVDSQLTQSLPAQVLLPFLKSWAASDNVQLALVLTTDATAVARTGMSGQVSDPVISRTQVLAGPTTTAGQERTYNDGDVVTALITVDWSTSRGAGQRAAYVLTLHRSAGRWQVHDITGAAPDPTGGAAATVSPATP